MIAVLYNHKEGIYLKLDIDNLDVLGRIFILLSILIGTFSPIKHCFAQNEFRHYSSDEGFTGSGFKTLVQDSSGFLWIASNSSMIFKFDGFTFTSYKMPSMSAGISTASLNPVWLDTKGNLWAMGPNSISSYDADSNSFQGFKISVDGETPHTAYPDKDGVWLGAAGKGLIRFDFVTHTQTDYLNNKNRASIAEINTIRWLEDEGEYLLLGTDRGLWKFDKDAKEFSRPFCSITDSTLMYSGHVRKIFRIANQYWLWIDNQLVNVNSRFAVIQRLDFTTILEKFDNDKKFKVLNVPKIIFDPEGFFWITSQGLGLIRYDPESEQLFNYRNVPTLDQSLPSDVLHDVMVDRDGNVWVTTVNKGIAKIKKQSLRFYNYMSGISTTGIDFLKGEKSNYVVTGTTGNGLWIASIDGTLPDKLKFEKVKLEPFVKGFENAVELCTENGRLWIGSLNSGVAGFAIDKQTGKLDVSNSRILQKEAGNINTISDNFVTALMGDSRGHLWAGTGSSGLNEIDLSAEYGTPGSVNRYRFNINATDTINDDHAADVKIDVNNSAIVGTNSGIYVIHSKSDSHSSKVVPIVRGIGINKILMASDGTLFAGAKTGLLEVSKSVDGYSVKPAPLPGNPFITCIQEDGLGRIWCSSFEGLFCYDRRSQFVSVFRKEDGMPSSRTVNAAGSVRTPEGLMIFSNSEGITVFDPLSLKPSRVKPKPILTKLRINNKDVSSIPTEDDDRFVLSGNINTLKELTLNHKHIILTIEFSAMDFTFPEKNSYKYMLKGFDKEWVYTDWKDRIATYTNLNSGTYTFIVMASNSDGIWSDRETTLTIRVLPPPWKTWWAYSIYGVILASVLFVARRNIIQHERLEAKLKMEHLELQKVQEIDKVKTNFFANISHEFRTPLTLIQGPVQLLLEKFRKDGEAESQLTLIQQNADRLLRLVNQILELARLESGGLKIETSQSDVIDFLRRIVGSFSSLAIQKRISFVQQFPDHGLLASFDRDKLEKITTNLISNAIKFTPENGAVIVNTSFEIKPEGKATLTFRVTDTGKGIPEDKLDKIFERFYQVKEDGNVNVGSGIGLALCKELAEFLGGSLTLESKVGEGSRFAMKIPLSDVEQTSGPEVESSSQEDITVEEIKVNQSSNGNTEKPLLLIVEDHSELRKFIIACLGTNYQFVEASNGREGLSSAIDQVPTMILSDVMMPEMDGMEMCRKIKSDPRTSHIPVILITARASDESRLTGLETGADDYIVKPFNKDELVLKIRNQVAARARMQERIRLEFLSQGSVVKAVSADEKFLEKLKKIVEARLSDEMLSVESLTEEIGMSRAQLYRKVTALTGISGNEFIRKLRLQKAAQLLQQQTGPVSQVAYEVGFSNLSYFSKCFKEEFGVLPSEYGLHASVRR